MARPKKSVNKTNNDNLNKAAEVAGNIMRSSDVAAGLAKIISDAGISQAPPQSKKQDRWEMKLDDKTAVAAEQFVGATTLMKACENRVETTKTQIVSYCSKEVIKKIWENKSKPSNPEILLRDSSGEIDHRFIFMCQDRLKVEHSEIPEKTDVKEFFVEIFERVGLSTKNATSLVENELNFNPVTGIRSLTELLDGYYGAGREWIESSSDEKAAGLKLAKLLMWDGSGSIEPLTPTEKLLVVKTSPNVVVKAEFFSRVALYCDSLDQLEGVFSVIKPVYSVGHVKYAMTGNKIARATAVANDIVSSL